MRYRFPLAIAALLGLLAIVLASITTDRSTLEVVADEGIEAPAVPATRSEVESVAVSSTPPPAEPIASAREEVASENPKVVSGRVLVPPGAPSEPELAVRCFWYVNADPLDRIAAVGPDGAFACELPGDVEHVRLALVAEYLYLPAVIEFGPDTPTHELILEPKVGGQLRLRFVLPAGLNATDVVGKTAQLVGWTTGRSDWIGVWREAVIQAGPVALFRSLPAKVGLELTVNVPGSTEVALAPVRTKRGDVVDASVTLALPVVLAGSCVDEEGRPLAGASVTATVHVPEQGGHTQQSMTAADGSFRFDRLPPGRTTLTSTLEGHRASELELGDLEPGMIRNDLVLTLRLGNVLSGRVLWPDGAPAVDARVEFVDPESDDSELLVPDLLLEAGVAVDEAGRFELIGLGSSPVSVEARCRLREQDLELEGLSGIRRRKEIQHAPWAFAAADSVPSDANELVLILERGPDLVGTVQDDSGRSLDRFQVTVIERVQGEGFERREQVARETFRRAAGQFRFQSLPPGEYEVQAAASDEAESIPVAVRLPGGPVQLVIPLGHRLSGRVIDAAGRPVPTAEVHLVLEPFPAESSDRASTGSRESSTRSAEDGSFEFSGSSAGRGRVFAVHEELGMGGPVEVTLGPNDPPAAEVVLELGGVGALEGALHESVADRSGRQIRFMILALDDAGELESDVEGTFELSPLPAGSYSIWLADDPATLRIFEVVADGTTQLVLGEQRAAPISISVRLQDRGSVLAHQPIRAMGSPLPKSWIVESSTDERGIARLELPWPGLVRFQIGFESEAGVELDRLIPDRIEQELDLDISTARPIER